MNRTFPFRSIRKVERSPGFTQQFMDFILGIFNDREGNGEFLFHVAEFSGRPAGGDGQHLNLRTQPGILLYSLIQAVEPGGLSVALRAIDPDNLHQEDLALHLLKGESPAFPYPQVFFIRFIGRGFHLETGQHGPHEGQAFIPGLQKSGQDQEQAG